MNAEEVATDLAVAHMGVVEGKGSQDVDQGFLQASRVLNAGKVNVLRKCPVNVCSQQKVTLYHDNYNSGISAHAQLHV